MAKQSKMSQNGGCEAGEMAKDIVFEGCLAIEMSL
jgi:hypothetical protein